MNLPSAKVCFFSFLLLPLNFVSIQARICGSKELGTHVVPYIVNGVLAQPNTLEFTVVVGTVEDELYFLICSGVIVHRWWVITAAHCFDVGDEFFVLVGTQDKYNSDEELYILAETYFAHENYNETGKYENDIGLIKPERALEWSNNLKKIFINVREIEFTYAVAAGFGDIDFNGTKSQYLREVKLQQKYSLCGYFYKGFFDITTQICAGGPDTSTGDGDSGGPLLVQHYNMSFLIGITSIGLNCGTKAAPSVFTRVNAYLDWLEDTTGGSLCYLNVPT